jgi:hypothetical protein
MHKEFWWGNLREGDHLEGLDVEGRIIIRWIFRKCDKGDMDRIDLALYMNRWRTLVNGVISLRIPYNIGNFLTT